MAFPDEPQLFLIDLPTPGRPVSRGDLPNDHGTGPRSGKPIKDLALDFELLPVPFVLGEAHFVDLLGAIVGVEHAEGLDGLRGLEGDFLALVEGLAGEVGLGREDLFPGSPATLDPVPPAGLVLGLLVLGAEVVEESVVDGELVGGEAFRREAEGEGRGGRGLEAEKVGGLRGIGLERGSERFREGEEEEEEIGSGSCLKDLHRLILSIYLSIYTSYPFYRLKAERERERTDADRLSERGETVFKF